MLQRALFCAAIFMLPGCTAMEPLSFASTELRLGYSAVPRLDREPFAELDALKTERIEPSQNALSVRASVPVPKDRPTQVIDAAQQPSTPAPAAAETTATTSLESSSTPGLENAATPLDENTALRPQQSAALPAYDESKDPNVTSVIRPLMTRAEVDQVYRKRPGGKITLPPMATLPIIETESIRTALASAQD